MTTVDCFKVRGPGSRLRLSSPGGRLWLTVCRRQAQAAAEDYCRAKWTAEDAPETVRLAVLLMASHFYEFRDSSDRNAYNTMMHAFHALLYPNRVIDSMF